MSGPSLKKRAAHSSIHEAALNEAKELRDLYQTCLKEKEIEKAAQVAEIAIEHWESRTLNHAQSEEEGLYRELVEAKPDLSRLIIQLTRDHDLLRRMVADMKERLMKNEIDERITTLLDSLMVVDSIHNEDEMNKLLADNES